MHCVFFFGMQLPTVYLSSEMDLKLVLFNRINDLVRCPVPIATIKAGRDITYQVRQHSSRDKTKRNFSAQNCSVDQIYPDVSYRRAFLGYSVSTLGLRVASVEAAAGSDVLLGEYILHTGCVSPVLHQRHVSRSATGLR
jgi:hypothetical protein